MPTQASLTTILVNDLVSNGPGIINGNFAELNLNGTQLSAGNMQIALSADAINSTDDQLAMTPLKVELKMINTSNILPKTTDNFNLGSSILKYDKLYLSDEIDFNGQTFKVNGAGNILINGSLITIPSGQFVELTGAQTVAGEKTFTNQMFSNAGVSLSGSGVELIFDEASTGNSGISFKDDGANIASMKYIDASQAIRVGVNDPFNYSWEFTSEIIFGTGTKNAPDFVSGVADNGISASKIKRYKSHINESVTTLSGAQVDVVWSATTFSLYPDEGESGNVILAQRETDIFLPPLTRDGGATNSGGTTYTIVNMSNNLNVEIFSDASISDKINGTTSLSNAVRFSSITLMAVYKKQFGTGAKEGHWIVTSSQGTWV